jgi:CrcB protein
MQYVAIAAGAVLGANLRFIVSTWAADQWGTTFPYGTFLINVSGCFVIGLFLALIGARFEVDPLWRLFFATGLLGGYTTFSTYAWEALVLADAGAWARAGAYVLGSNVVGLLGVWLRATLARSLALQTQWSTIATACEAKLAPMPGRAVQQRRSSSADRERSASPGLTPRATAWRYGASDWKHSNEAPRPGGAWFGGRRLASLVARRLGPGPAGALRQTASRERAADRARRPQRRDHCASPRTPPRRADRPGGPQGLCAAPRSRATASASARRRQPVAGPNCGRWSAPGRAPRRATTGRAHQQRRLLGQAARGRG